MKKRIFSLIACFTFLAVTAFPNWVASAAKNETADDIIVQNDKYSMTADSNSGLFSITDKSSGYVWNSVPDNLDDDTFSKKKDKLDYGSQLLIEYVNNEDFVNSGKTETANSKIQCVNKGTTEVEKIDNGIKVIYNFEKVNIIIPVKYALTDNGFKASICTKEIKEGKEFSLISVNLLPTFGAADWSSNGYIFVPDGSGAIINYNNGIKENKYEADIYGKELQTKVIQKKLNNETIRMPVFGSYNSDNHNGFLGIVTTGDTSASLKAVCGNTECGYNMVSSAMKYRFFDSDSLLSQANTTQKLYRTSKQKYSLKEYAVNYFLFNTEKTGYVKMADIYRNYLVKNKNLEKTASDSVINIDTYGAFETDGNFLGIKYKKLVPLTKYSEVKKITDGLKKSGADDIAIRYIGWSNDGILNRSQMKSVKFINTLGSKKQWKKMITDLDKSDIKICFDADLLLLRKGGNSLYAANVFNKRIAQQQYMPSVYSTRLNVDSWYLLSSSKIENAAEKYLKSLVSNNISDISLSTLTNMIYSDFNEKSGAFRSEFSAIADNIFKKYKKEGITLSGEEANAYALPYLSKIYKAPVTSSGYKLFNKEIPFYQIVLHGYIPMTVKPAQHDYYDNYNFLKAAETGSELLFNGIYGDSNIFRESLEEDLYSSTYNLWSDKATEQYKKYHEIFNSVANLEITEHSEISENVMKTVFGDSVTVIVNYNDTDVVIDGTVVSAKSFIKY